MEKLLKKIDNLIRFWWLLIIVLSLPAVWALFVPGYFGASDDMHIAWAYQMYKVLNLGQIPPRFVPDLSFGFGYPLFNFVFPLPFYLAQIFHISGLSFVDSIKGVLLFSLIASGLAMYLLLRELTSRPLGLAGAMLYIFTPYRSVDTYIRGAVGEAIAFVFLPLIILSFLKLIDPGKRSLYWVGIGALSISALALSHNISAYMFMPFAFLFLVFNIIFSKKISLQIIFQVLITIFLGLLISLYFWLPAIAESSLMKYETVFNFSDHYPTLKQLFIPYWGYGASVPGPYDGISFFLGLTNIGVVLLGVFLTVLTWKKNTKAQRGVLIWSLISLVIAIFMMNFRSQIVWDNLPFVAYFQFPWRFLIITTFAIPLLSVSFSSLKYSAVVAAFLVVLSMLLNLNVFRPQDFLGRTDEYYLKRYIPTPIVDKEYYQIQEEYLRLPKTTLTRPDRLYPRVISNNGEIRDLKLTNDLEAKFETSSAETVLVNYNKYLFPGWNVYVDGKPMETFAGTPFGQISFLVPAGEHKVKVTFSETPQKRVFNMVSLASLLLSLSFVTVGIVRKDKLKLS